MKKTLLLTTCIFLAGTFTSFADVMVYRCSEVNRLKTYRQDSGEPGVSNAVVKRRSFRIFDTSTGKVTTVFFDTVKSHGVTEKGYWKGLDDGDYSWRFVRMKGVKPIYKVVTELRGSGLDEVDGYASGNVRVGTGVARDVKLSPTFTMASVPTVIRIEEKDARAFAKAGAGKDDDGVFQFAFARGVCRLDKALTKKSNLELFRVEKGLNVYQYFAGTTGNAYARIQAYLEKRGYEYWE